MTWGYGLLSLDHVIIIAALSFERPQMTRTGRFENVPDGRTALGRARLWRSQVAS